VTGRAWPISQIAGWRVRSDAPKSPWTAPPRNRRYWMYTGWSSPSWWRNRARSAAVPLSPSSNSATSPGIRCIPKNTRMLTPRSTGTSCTSRRATYFSIGASRTSRPPPHEGPAGWSRRAPQLGGGRTTGARPAPCGRTSGAGSVESP
jgi:hypothetical protein